jgi:hypothetical protein
MTLAQLTLHSVNDGTFNKCGTVGGMGIGMGSQSNWRKFASVPFCLPQIPHDLTWAKPSMLWWEATTNRLTFSMP